MNLYFFLFQGLLAVCSLLGCLRLSFTSVREYRKIDIFFCRYIDFV